MTNLDSRYFVECDARYGRMTVFRNDTYVSHSVRRYGEWCQNELNDIGQVLRRGDVVIDVGANVGTHALALAAAVGPTGKVLAFEPQPLVFDLLRRNVLSNGLTNVFTYHAAVGMRAGDIAVPDLAIGDWGNYSAVSLVHREIGEAVELTTLDNLNLEACRLIKVDVEGMEVDVVTGATSLIRRFKPILFVENSATNSEQLVSLMIDLGYDLYWHISSLFNAENYRQETENVFPDKLAVNIFGFHRDSAISVSGLSPVLGPTDTWLEANARNFRT